MSNPGVVFLAEGTVSGQPFRVEDNIGEAIHIHWGNIRIDMSISKFIDTVKALKIIVESMVDVKGFCFSNYDAIFLAQDCDDILRLDKIEFEEVNVSNLLTNQYDANGYIKYVGLANARIIKAINGDLSEVYNWRQTNYLGDDNISRVEKMRKKINSDGYAPEKFGSYVVLLGATNIVLDGCHRASCVLNDYGKVAIRVARWYLRGELQGESEVIDKISTWYNQMIGDKLCRIINNKKLTKYLLERELAGKKVILKGAGLHSTELLKILDREIVNIVGIQDNNLHQEYWNGILVMSKSDICKECADVILISSYRYRHEMMEEMKTYSDLEIYDIYSNGINEEFFSAN